MHLQKICRKIFFVLDVAHAILNHGWLNLDEYRTNPTIEKSPSELQDVKQLYIYLHLRNLELLNN